MGGMVVGKTIKMTRNNDMMAFIEIEDLYGTIEVVVFPNVFRKYKNIINEDSILIIKGNLNIKEDENPKLIANEITQLNEDYELGYNLDSKLYIKIDSIDNKKALNDIFDVIKKYSGKQFVYIYDENTKKSYRNDDFRVKICESLLNELYKFIPAEYIKIK